MSVISDTEIWTSFIKLVLCRLSIKKSP